MKLRHRSCCDRRSGHDRRCAYSLDYFDNGGRERRRGANRRRRIGRERRARWSRIGGHVSVYRDWPDESGVSVS